MRLTKRYIYCDACGEEITDRDYRSIVNVMHFNEDDLPDNDALDLCKECTKSFAEWRKSRSKKKPPSDLTSIVRCKDCIHADTFPMGKEMPEAPLKCLDIRYGGVFPNWFCERGERRDSRCKKD